MNSLLQLSPSGAPPEATLLNLSIEKADRLLGWKPKWGFEETIAKTVSWYARVHAGTVTPRWKSPAPKSRSIRIHRDEREKGDGVIYLITRSP